LGAVACAAGALWLAGCKKEQKSQPASAPAGEAPVTERAAPHPIPPSEAENPAPAGAGAPAAAPAPPAPPAGSVAEIKVTNTGVITVNGTTATLDDVKRLLSDPAKKPTGIRYQRENAEQDPAPNAVEIVRGLLQALLDSKIPVTRAP
jgi:hypothetical protein